MRERSRISVRHTTSESMLNPRPAKIPETRESTPGSFCTRQFSTCLAGVGEKGRGVSDECQRTRTRVARVA